jgi:hypothetical protein
MQAKVSPTDFDYLGYFFLRFGEYKKQSVLLVRSAKLSFRDKKRVERRYRRSWVVVLGKSAVVLVAVAVVVLNVRFVLFGFTL